MDASRSNPSGSVEHATRECKTFEKRYFLAEQTETGSDPHLVACVRCRDGVRRDRLALAALRAAAGEGSGRTAVVLTRSRRSNLLERPGCAFAWGRVPGLDWRSGAMVAAAAITSILIGAWTLFQPPSPADRNRTVAGLASVPAGVDLEVANVGSAVTLSWESARDGEHRVLRATDPRDLASGRVEVVRGNRWVDPDTNGSRLVFYVVD